MRTLSSVDVGDMTRFNPDRRAPLWWGILGLISIEATVVAGLVVSYLYIAAHAEVWPPAGLEPQPLFWPSVNVGLLLLSSYVMYRAGQAIKRGDKTRLAAGVTLAVLLDCLVLVLRWREFQLYEFSWKDHVYGSLVWTISGFHFTHVVSAVVGSAVVAILAWRGYFTKERQIGVVVDTMYWYFVSFAWIPFYLTVYWVPRLYAG